MPDRSFKVDKWVRTDEDYGQMNWHDVVIHGFATSHEELSEPHAEPFFEPQELLFDIDYVLNWREAVTERRADFWVSPATLVFADVSNLGVNFQVGVSRLLIIYAIRREGLGWTISMDEGQIAFDSGGFKQYIRREPVLKTHYTYLTDSERGGFSFRRSRD